MGGGESDCPVVAGVRPCGGAAGVCPSCCPALCPADVRWMGGGMGERKGRPGLGGPTKHVPQHFHFLLGYLVIAFKVFCVCLVCLF